MEITEVKIKLVDDAEDKLQAFATVTFDSDFVVRDLKVIDGNNGLFVAMPSRKLTDKCEKCGAKNHLRASHCNECGTKLRHRELAVDEQGRPKLHVDVAHPINSKCREYLQSKVLDQFQKELIRAKGARPDVIADSPRVESPKADAPAAEPAKADADEAADEKKSEDDKREFGMGIFS